LKYPINIKKVHANPFPKNKPLQDIALQLLKLDEPPMLEDIPSL
jgi:hypothetical protein